MISKVKKFYTDVLRIFRVSRKPTSQEFKTMSKITGLGIVVIGLIGFVITFLFFLLFK